MKKLLTICLIMATVFAGNSQTIGTWAEKESLGNDLTARSDAGMVTIGTDLYILGGYDRCGPKDFTKYNALTGEINKLPNLGIGCANPIYGGALFAVDNNIYSFASGLSVFNVETSKWVTSFMPFPSGNGSIVPDSGFVIGSTIYIISNLDNVFYAYNTITKVFTRKANYPGLNRRGAIAFAIDDKGYFGTGRSYGYDGCNTETGCFLDDFYEYNPITNSWTTKENLPIALNYGAGISIGKKGYAGFGEVKGSLATGSQTTNKWFEYDAVNNIWTSKTDTPYGVTLASISNINNDIYIFGGRNNFGTYHDDLIKYNIANNSWGIVNNELGQNRIEASGFYTNGKIYVGGGHNSEGLYDFWEYTIATNKWVQKSNFPTSHTQRGSTNIGNKGYFIGGYGQQEKNTVSDPYANHLDKLLEYNADTNVWTEKAAYPGGKRANMIMFTYENTIYAGFGKNPTGEWLKDFYKYNPTTNVWTPLSTPSIMNLIDLSYFLVGETVYFVSNNPTSTTYKYNLQTATWSSETHNLNNFQSTDKTNQAFSFNGVGYIVNGPYSGGDILSAYNPLNGTWSQVLNMPFKSMSQTIIPTPSGIYFGFGEGGSYNDLGILHLNTWKALRFNGNASTKTGIYSTTSSNGYLTPTIPCTGALYPGATQTVYDMQGDIFASLTYNGTSNISSCFEVNSIDQNFRIITRKFENNYNQNAMLSNKSILFINTTSEHLTTLRLYYTSAELNKLVSDFNTQYSSNKTLADIKIFQFVETGKNDHDPFNNTSTPTLKIYNSVISNYGTDKYFELNGSNVNPIQGEIYVGIISDTNLGITDYKKNLEYFSISPNPTSSVLNIELKDNFIVDKMILTNATGQKIKELSKNTKMINMESLQNGIYFIQIISGKDKYTQKIIKN